MKMTQKCDDCVTVFYFTKKDIKIITVIEKSNDYAPCGERFETQGSFLTKIKSRYIITKITDIQDQVKHSTVKCPVCSNIINLQELDRKEISRVYGGTSEDIDINYFGGW